MNGGNHHKISALMTGIFNHRRLKRGHTFLRDVETVLVYLRSKPEDQCLSDKVLTLKF